MQQFAGETPLLIAGSGEDEAYFRQVAGGDPRIHFLGFVSDAELLELYANALAVLFPPKEEDYGYIAVEAMLSHKPVIVCTDSGEPARVVQNGRSGFVVNPNPSEIAAAMTILADDRELARSMGEFGFRSVPSQSWDEVVERLLAAGEPAASRVGVPAASEPEPHASPPIELPTRKHPIAMLVADNQVLDPPVGGGRIRIYELYRHIAALGFRSLVRWRYDWPRAGVSRSISRAAFSRDRNSAHPAALRREPAL